MLQQQDAPQILRSALRDILTVPVRSELPPGWEPRKGQVITVTSDGTTNRHPAYDREIIRIVAYARDQTTARTLAATADEYLIDPRRPPGILITPSQGLNLARDTDLGCWVASVTVEATTPRR